MTLISRPSLLDRRSLSLSKTNYEVMNKNEMLSGKLRI